MSEKKTLGSLELNRIYQMDCLEGMRLLPDGSVDLIIADPPYFQIKGDFDFKWRSRRDWLEWCGLWIYQCVRVLKEGGSFYIWGGWSNISWIQVYIEENYDVTLRNKIIWHYGSGNRATRIFAPRHEECLFYTKGRKRYTFNIDDVRITSKYNDKRNHPLGKNPTDCWYFNRYPANDRRYTGHPTQKHDGVCNRIIKASSNVDDIVLIPFVGSGSECVAALRNNRNFIGFEIEPEYVRIANQRLENVRDELAERKLTEGTDVE